MSRQAAEVLLLAATAGSVVAWLLALGACARLFGPGAGAGGAPAESVRTLLVSGRIEDVADGLVRALASGGWGAAPLLVRREGHRLIAAVPAAPPRLGAAPAFSRCAVELRPAGEASVEATVQADYSAVRRQGRVIAAALLAAGAAVIAGLAAGLWLWALPSDRPGVRAQAVQAFQAVHLLWPPWLVCALYRRSRRATDMFLDSAAANAAVLAEAFAAGRRKAAGDAGRQ